MRKLITIIEGPDEDARRHEWAADVYRHLVSYLRARKRVDVEVESDLGTQWGVETSNLKLPPEYGLDNAIILIGERRADTVGGSGGMFAHIGEWAPGILVQVARGPEEKDAVIATGSLEFREILMHELIHVFDDIRSKGFASRKSIAADSAKTDPKGYLNEPMEFNARYHDIANNMLDILSQLKREPELAQDLMDLYGLTGNFAIDLMNLLKAARTSSSHNAFFLKHITDSRRRAMLKRLYKLHSAIVAAARR